MAGEMKTRRILFFALACAIALPASAGEGFYMGFEGGASLARDQELKQGGAEFGELTFDPGYVGGFLLGGTVIKLLRPELELNYRRNNLGRFTPANGVEVAGNGFVDVYTVMANLWLEGRDDEGPLRVFHPYGGFGIGGARVSFHDATFGAIPANDSFRTLFAYQAGGGVGFDVTPEVTLSLDYRYLQTNVGRFDLSPGNRTALRYSAHTPMMSVRFSFAAAEERPSHPIAPPPRAYPPTRTLPPPPADTDADGVPDDVDRCPNTPPSFKVDIEGCMVQQKVILQSVNFETASDRLTGSSRATLDQVAAALRGQPDLKIEIDGHTDGQGAAQANQLLSVRRANAVRAYLIAKGVAASRLDTRGFGETRPIADNATEAGRARNRRVEFVVIGRGAPATIDQPRRR